MPATFRHSKKRKIPLSFKRFWKPAVRRFRKVPALSSRGHRPLQMEFEDQLKILVYYHLQEHKSGRHLLQDMEENDFVRRETGSGQGDQEK